MAPSDSLHDRLSRAIGWLFVAVLAGCGSGCNNGLPAAPTGDPGAGRTTGVGAGSSAYCHPQCTDYAACGQTWSSSSSACTPSNSRVNFSRCWDSKLYGDAGQWVAHAGSCVVTRSYPSNGSLFEIQFADNTGHVGSVDSVTYNAAAGSTNSSSATITGTSTTATAHALQRLLIQSGAASSSRPLPGGARGGTP